MVVETVPTVCVPATEPTLAALTARLEAGDPVAFEEIFRRFHEPLVRYARRFTSDDATAYDILQDVFMRLWEKRASLGIHTSIQGMLCTMVRNRAFNLHRDSRRVVDMPEEMSERSTTDALPDGDLEFRDLNGYIKRWIDELPPRRAEAFVLSRYHGLKHTDIASIMQVSKRTVDTHILLALQYLRKRLDAWQDGRGLL